MTRVRRVLVGFVVVVVVNATGFLYSWCEAVTR